MLAVKSIKENYLAAFTSGNAFVYVKTQMRLVWCRKVPVKFYIMNIVFIYLINFKG